MPRYPVPQPDPAVVGPSSVRKVAGGPSPPPPPQRFLIQGLPQADYVPGPPLVKLLLTATPATAVPTRFLIRALAQPDYVASQPVVILRLAPTVVTISAVLLRGLIQPEPEAGLGPRRIGSLPVGRIAGVTRDNTGAPLGNCVVHLFRTSDDVKIATTTSDGSGNYSFPLLLDGRTYYCVAYLAGAPDVAGTTDNTLVAA